MNEWVYEFEHFGFSDPGKVRSLNEDSYLCNEKEGLFLVADGLGGHVSGGTASQMAVQRIEEFVTGSRADESRWPLETEDDLTPEQRRLLSATLYANGRIHEIASNNPDMKGMGTTIVGAIIEGDHLAVANVGDSRLYRIREEEISQVTRDHTLVGKQERRGIISREEARKHPQRHILTSALGVNDHPRIDVSLCDIQPGDTYLFCSDGLYDVLEDKDILTISQSITTKPLYRVGLSLILQANLAGGPDNITVVLLYFKS